MKNRKFSLKAIVLSCALLVAVICGTVILVAARSNGNNSVLEYLVNEYGQTYGSAQYAYSVESLPDLIHAGGVDGVDIYIYAEAILSAMPKTDDEMQDGSFLQTVFQLYEVDGSTIVGSADYSFGIQFIPVTLRSEYAIPAYLVNENGQTFGTMAFVGPNNPFPPDLIAAVGIDGTEGYVYQRDLDAEKPNNPDEAVEYMKRYEERMEEMRRTGEMFFRIIPLYAADGVTVIGEFGVGGGEVNN